MLNCFLNFFRIHQPVHMILVSSVHYVPSQNIFCKDLNILRAIINLNTCRNSKLKLSLFNIYTCKAEIKKANRRNGVLSSPRINLLIRSSEISNPD